MYFIIKALISRLDKINKRLDGGSVKSQRKAPQTGAADAENELPAVEESTFDKRPSECLEGNLKGT